MDSVRWGVLSVSNHYRLRVHHQLIGSGVTKVLGIASRDAGRAKQAARELGLARSFGSYEAMLADPEIDAVYIPLPNHLHAQWINKAADAGKHVLCEKPFAMDAAQAAEAVRYAESKGVRVMEAFMYRFHPQWAHTKQVVQSGEIGKVQFVQIQFTYNNKDPRNIRNILDTGGGAMYDIGCYACSSSRFVMGKEPERAISIVRRDAEFGTDTLSSAMLDFGDARALFTVSTQSFPVQQVDIFGTSGTITIFIPYNMYDDVPAEVRITTGIGPRMVRLGPAGQYRLMFDAFSKSIIEGKPVPTPPEDAIANMRAIDALFRSEKSGLWEKV
ncbi:putative enzyme [uncultured spirochete]|uniref:Putative enzyme n=1 Tax=uncultured spirochete TaxID=156406 RepID=A0A3P3XS12_9SPIR|nr:putative enzyme [uncultured spirochete]